jgi:hypothetical protein
MGVKSTNATIYKVMRDRPKLLPYSPKDFGAAASLRVW